MDMLVRTVDDSFPFQMNQHNMGLWTTTCLDSLQANT
jgi:hypothetical protein